MSTERPALDPAKVNAYVSLTIATDGERGYCGADIKVAQVNIGKQNQIADTIRPHLKALYEALAVVLGYTPDWADQEQEPTPYMFGGAPMPPVEKLEEYERAAEEFRARWGLSPTDPWPDELIERVLAEYHFPPLVMLPAEPQGGMRDIATKLTDFTEKEALAWQRTNAFHLIAHAMVETGLRCDACRDW
jgi:hypothetical protein